jgi:hypothetical protein
MNPSIIDSTDRLHLEVDRGMKVTSATIEATQEIPDSFLRQLADERKIQDGMFAPDELKLCSLPGALVDTWYRQGFNIWDKNVTAKDIVNRLKAEGLTKFLATTKTIG